MEELSLNILDIAQNSVRANATRVDITVAELPAEDRLVITINDNGCGMTPEQVAHVEDPFYTTRTTRKVGLGLPLLRLAAEQTGGSVEITSTEGAGTTLRAVFNAAHIDCPPPGDMGDTLSLLIQGAPVLEIVYTRAAHGRRFRLDTAELREQLGPQVSLAQPEVALWVRDYIREQEAALHSPEPRTASGDRP